MSAHTSAVKVEVVAAGCPASAEALAIAVATISASPEATAYWGMRAGQAFHEWVITLSLSSVSLGGFAAAWVDEGHSHRLQCCGVVDAIPAAIQCVSECKF